METAKEYAGRRRYVEGDGGRSHDGCFGCLVYVEVWGQYGGALRDKTRRDKGYQ